MNKNIISIGFEIPHYSDFFHNYTSGQSLLDADIVVFSPTFQYDELDFDHDFNGKVTYTNHSSFKIKEASEHWSTELITALNEGKTIFIFFEKYLEFNVHTGHTEYSGTGKNARQTQIIGLYNNYKFFPIKLPKIISKSGNQLKFTGNPLLGAFYNDFKAHLSYKSYIDEKVENTTFITKTGDKTLGAIFKVGKGNIILLPPLSYKVSDFTEETDEGDYAWNDEAKKFGSRLIQTLVDIDKSIKSTTEATPPPIWAADGKYALNKVTDIKKNIGDTQQKIEVLIEAQQNLHHELIEEESLQALLFEKGKPLENAIIKALRILGYNAENYVDDDLEIDQIIISPEGQRFIGEAEGKDSAQINIDKFRQLENNIQEDLQKDDVTEPATGILFGNAFRLQDPEQRADFFTDKCCKNAKRLNVILIKTTDLYKVVQYIKNSGDTDFIITCRDCIANSLGQVVQFPPIP